MYTILLKNDKSLVASKKVVIYQKEENYDVIYFIIPHTLEDNDISLLNSSVFLTYKDPGNVVHQEVLSLVDDTYKDHYMKYSLPVNTELTRFAGDLELSLTFVKPNEVGEDFNVVMHSGSIRVTISPLSNQYAIADSSSFLEVAKAIANLSDKLDETAENIPTDLTIDDDLVQLTTETDIIGTGVRVFAPSDEIDVNADGMTDLSEIYENDETVSNYEDSDEDDYNYNNPEDVSWEII